jgi:hypothetical protein
MKYEHRAGNRIGIKRLTYHKTGGGIYKGGRKRQYSLPTSVP